MTLTRLLHSRLPPTRRAPRDGAHAQPSEHRLALALALAVAEERFLYNPAPMLVRALTELPHGVPVPGLAGMQS